MCRSEKENDGAVNSKSALRKAATHSRTLKSVVLESVTTKDLAKDVLCRHQLHQKAVKIL